MRYSKNEHEQGISTLTSNPLCVRNAVITLALPLPSSCLERKGMQVMGRSHLTQMYITKLASIV
jgi:hypothetical protein